VTTEALTLTNILGGSDTDDEAPCNGQRVQLSSTEIDEYGTRIAREACGRLELKEIYKETFLLCHALVGGIILENELRKIKSVNLHGNNRSLITQQY